MKATLDHFEELKKEDPDFIYSYTLDEFDRVENLFQVDGAARNHMRSHMSSMVIAYFFDTTYLTNMYNMPCAPFIGKKFVFPLISIYVLLCSNLCLTFVATYFISTVQI